MGVADKVQSAFADSLKTGVATLVAALTAYLLSERVLPWVFALATSLLLVFAVVARRWPARACRSLAADAPAREPLTPNWVRWSAGFTSVLLATLAFALTRQSVRDAVFPVVAIDRCLPSPLTWNGGKNGHGYVSHVPQLLRLADNSEVEAFRSLRLEVSARRGRAVRISEVRVASTPVKPAAFLFRAGAVLENVVLPHRYRAQMTPASPLVTTTLYDDNNLPTPGLVRMTESEPLVVLHIEFDDFGDSPHVYDVTAEVDVTDGDGNKRMVKTDRPVLIVVPATLPKGP